MNSQMDPPGVEEGRTSREREHRVRVQTRVSLVGILGNGILAAGKITVGFLTGSMAVVGDGIDSASDIITSVIGLFAARISNKPPDQEHPYGHERAETIATKLLSFIIAFAGFQLLVSTVGQLISGEAVQVPGIAALVVTAVSILGKAGLALYKGRAGRAIDSPMLVADAKNMRNDILLSAGVLAGVGLTLALELPVLDRILALIISLFIIKTGIQIFLETSVELMDGMNDPELYRRVFAAVHRVDGAQHPHKARIRRINTQLMVELDVEVDSAMTVCQGHGIANQVERQIRQAIPHVYDVLIHIEPLGVHHSQEAYGLCEADVELESPEGKASS